MDTSLWALFFSGFSSATLLPGSSEALFVFMLKQQTWETVFLILVVGLGNSLGGMSNWLLGVLIHLGWYKNKHKQTPSSAYIKAEKWLQYYGSPILLLSFLPIIGDPLCVLAGILRFHWLSSLLFISVGKLMRYIALSYFII